MFNVCIMQILSETIRQEWCSRDSTGMNVRNLTSGIHHPPSCQLHTRRGWRMLAYVVATAVVATATDWIPEIAFRSTITCPCLLADSCGIRVGVLVWVVELSSSFDSWPPLIRVLLWFARFACSSACSSACCPIPTVIAHIRCVLARWVVFVLSSLRSYTLDSTSRVSSLRKLVPIPCN